MPARGKSRPGWLAGIDRLAERIPPSRFHPRVVEWSAKRRKAETWHVAFSGGADSVALLLLLWAHRPERRGNLVALHFNHRLRGRESAADEVFCRKMCAALKIRLKAGRWAGRHRGASEAEARTARLAFFTAEMKKAGGRVLWLAHQQDDIAETLLMRLTRGSGAGGLAAPRPVQRIGVGRTNLRPLLGLKKDDLRKALREAGVPWREDSSNQAGRYFRNRIRRTVVPVWVEASGRDALAGAARSRELLEEDDEALENWAGRLGAKRGRVLDLRPLAQAPRAVIRRILHRWLLVVRPDTDLSRQGFELLLAAVERGNPARFSMGRKHFAVIEGGRLSLETGS